MALALTIVVASVASFLCGAFWGHAHGARAGYRRGFDASEFEHDFDRCKNCGEAPWFEEVDDITQSIAQPCPRCAAPAFQICSCREPN